MNWFNGDLDPITSGERYLISPLGTLYIREVVPSDSGMYYCRLNNSAGEAMVGARLQVINETINESKFTAVHNIPLSHIQSALAKFYFMCINCNR